MTESDGYPIPKKLARRLIIDNHDDIQDPSSVLLYKSVQQLWYLDAGAVGTIQPCLCCRDWP